MQLRVNRKANGRHLRVTVEQKPKELGALLEVQRIIQDTVPDFRAKDSDYLHLTLIHLGIPQDLYFEYRRVNPELTYDSFMGLFTELLQDLYSFTQSIEDEIGVEAEHLNLYGSARSPAVALSIIRNESIDQIHREIFTIVTHNLAKHLTNEPISFIEKSRNLHHAPPRVFNPHITLGRIPIEVDQLPTLPDSLSLTLEPPHLAQVTVM